MSASEIGGGVTKVAPDSDGTASAANDSSGSNPLHQAP
jgi:hypothetical protein